MIPTPSGFRALHDIHAGDFVFGRDGKVHTVLAESEEVTAPAWRLTFDDASTVIAHDDHHWLTFNAAELAAATRRTDAFRERRRETRPRRVSGHKSAAFTTSLTARNAAWNGPRPEHATWTTDGQVRTTAEIVATLLTPRGRRNHAIPVAQPLTLPARDLPLDPYLLGVWLGDGSSGSGHVTTMDSEIVAAFEDAGYCVQHITRKPQNRAATYRFGGLHAVLKRMGLLGNKHVPHDYLWASEEQRAALLAGLLDTDGGVSDTSVEFANTNQSLTEAVAHLARTLGHKVTVRQGRARLYGKDCGPKWRVCFTPNRILFRLPHKAQKQVLATRRTTQFRYIVGAERVDPVPMKCLRVSSDDHLYLVGESFIPTHNSSALLMSALLFVDVPHYAALIIRRTFQDLALPGAIMDRAADWLMPTAATWEDNTKTWHFPSGATLTFGYLQTERDKYRYQGSELQFCGIDEVSQLTETQYAYLLSRLRRPVGSPLPLRQRAASNPGDIGHEWVKARFVTSGPERPFIPARMADNPYLDQAAYRASLAGLDAVTRAQLEDGDWEVSQTGGLFERAWFAPQDGPYTAVARVRAWDLAASTDGDWSAGVRMARTDTGRYVIEHVAHFRHAVGERDAAILACARADGRDVRIVLEEEGGSAGKSQTASLARLLAGFIVSGERPTGPKDVRARPLASQLAAGNVRYLPGPWSSAFITELCAFPCGGVHDDQVDAASAAFGALASPRERGWA